MNKRIITIMLAACLLLFGGCQLAKSENGDTETHDTLVGVYVTVDKTLSEAANSEDIGAEPIYAEFSEVTCTDADGIEYIDYRYDFPDIDGIMLSCFKVTGDELIDGEPLVFNNTCADEEICKINTNFGNTGTKLSGTVYISSEKEEIVLYYNPVYQTESGSVYVLPGEGELYSAESGGTIEISLSETYQQTENGQTQESTNTVSVTVAFEHPCENSVFVQMDSENNVIKAEEFTSDNLPLSFSPDRQTAYIIVESHSKHGVSRSIYSPDDMFAITLIASQHDILIQKKTNLKW